ncbi:MAG TPA: urease accessory UreF family protein, partial [Urbifossiella sp.]|nr:urease accessory UreF family protein [Urbifossiella sp.]
MNLRLLQLADSALPVGGYTHSWGLEAALARGQVGEIESLERWTRNWLRHALGPLEGVVVGAACRAAAAGDWAALAGCNGLIDASLAPPTLRTASREMGRHLLQLGEVWPWSAAGVACLAVTDVWHHPVAFGVLGHLAGVPAGDAIEAFLHQAVIGMISAGARAVPVSHTHGQQLLAYLQPDIAVVAAVRGVLARVRNPGYRGAMNTPSARLLFVCLAAVVAALVAVPAPAAAPAPADVLAGLRGFFARTARPDGSFRPGIDPGYEGMSDSAFSDLAPVAYAVVLHKTFGWPLPDEARTRAFLLARQRADGSFVNAAGTVSPDSPAGRAYNTTMAVMALKGLGARPRHDPLPVFDLVLKADYKELPAYMTSFFPLAYLASGRPIPSAADRKIKALME